MRCYGNVIYDCPLFEKRFADTYINTFFDGYTTRKSCHICQYACPDRVSDITIGDFWGLKGELPLSHPNGCSVLLPITEKGRELVESIKSEFYLFERPAKEAINGNDQLRHPKIMNRRIEMFRKLSRYAGIEKAYRMIILDIILKREIKKALKYIRNILTNSN